MIDKTYQAIDLSQKQSLMFTGVLRLSNELEGGDILYRLRI